MTLKVTHHTHLLEPISEPNFIKTQGGTHNESGVFRNISMQWRVFSSLLAVWGEPYHVSFFHTPVLSLFVAVLALVTGEQSSGRGDEREIRALCLSLIHI